MKVTIKCRINVDGQWWDIDVETEADPQMSPAGKMAYLEKVIGGMAKTGRLISRVDNSVPAVKPANGQSAPTPEAVVTQPAFTWPEPHCEVHRQPMKPSNQQKKPGYTMFFCPQRLGGGYCGHRASVEVNSGMPKFWEIKQP